jgi:cyclic beta-1,2-glucan synthetase
VPGASVRLAFATGIASDRVTAEALARKYRDPSAASRTFALAFTLAQSGLRHLEISHDEALQFERLASRALFADGSLRADSDTIASNELGQASLWPHSISGDLPILLVRVVGDEDVALVRQILQAQEYWRLGLSADVVIINEDPLLPDDMAQLTALLDNGPWRTGNIDPAAPTVARRRIGSRSHVDRVRPGRFSAASGRPAFLDKPHPAHGGLRPVLAAAAVHAGVPAFTPPTTRPAMTLTNGLGGFTDEGRLCDCPEGDQETPLPWANVIANPGFGTVITASGSAHTWSENSRENRLTSFANDPSSIRPRKRCSSATTTRETRGRRLDR